MFPSLRRKVPIKPVPRYRPIMRVNGLTGEECRIQAFSLFVETVVQDSNREFAARLGTLGYKVQDFPSLFGSLAFEREIAGRLCPEMEGANWQRKRKAAAEVFAANPALVRMEIAKYQQERLDAWFKLVTGGAAFEEGEPPCSH